MRYLGTVCTVGCLALVATPAHGQDAALSEKRSESSIMASAARAAMGMELQPNAAPQRERRRGRLYGGLTLIAVGAGVLVAGSIGGEQAGGTERNVRYGMIWGGIGLASLGGVVMALADSRSGPGWGDGSDGAKFRSGRTGGTVSGREPRRERTSSGRGRSSEIGR